jgi:hypothetical protein
MNFNIQRALETRHKALVKEHVEKYIVIPASEPESASNVLQEKADAESRGFTRLMSAA